RKPALGGAFNLPIFTHSWRAKIIGCALMKINIDPAGGILNQTGRLTAPNNHPPDSDGIGVCRFLMFQLHDLVGGGQERKVSSFPVRVLPLSNNSPLQKQFCSS